MTLNYTNPYNQLLENMLVIGGSARSGTTIVGKLIHSLENVEYYFEPPLLIPLLLKEGKLSLSDLKELIYFYFYENFLLDCLAGRNVNLNRQDDSCIYHAKSEQDISNRMSQSLRRVELEKRCQRTIFAFKLPEVIFHLPLFKQLFPQSRLILVYRNPIAVIQSLIKKAWFSNEYLTKNHPAQLYSRKILQGKKIPYWVKSADEDFWVSTTEYNRCAYYYERVSDCMLEMENSACLINYDRLIINPSSELANLYQKLNLQPTPQTATILQSIHPTSDKNANIIQHIDHSQWQKIETMYDQIRQVVCS